jgi:hypothetical protein
MAFNGSIELARQNPIAAFENHVFQEMRHSQPVIDFRDRAPSNPDIYSDHISAWHRLMDYR